MLLPVPDVHNLSDVDRMSTQQTHGLAVTGSSVRPETLGFGMCGVFLDDVTAVLDPNVPFISPFIVRYIPLIGLPRRSSRPGSCFSLYFSVDHLWRVPTHILRD